jgi:hypothetical protein
MASAGAARQLEDIPSAKDGAESGSTAARMASAAATPMRLFFRAFIPLPLLVIIRAMRAHDD